MRQNNSEPTFLASENPNPILRTTQNGVLLYANSAANELLAYWQIAVGDELPEIALHTLHASQHTRKLCELEVVANQHIYLLHFKAFSEANRVDIYGFNSTMHKQLVMMDQVTRFPNRFYFRKLIEIELEKESQRPKALLLIDIDDLSLVKQNQGVAVADALLHAVAKRIESLIKNQHLKGNLSYREFAILQKTGDIQQVKNLVANLLEKLAKPYRIKQRQITIQPNIGVALYPKDTLQASSLVSYAGLALSKAKTTTEHVQFYRRYMTSITKARTRLEKELQKAITSQQFCEYYQPQIKPLEGSVVGAEALIRWNHPRHGLLTPQHFISQVEELGWISDLSLWMLNTVCQQAANWNVKDLSHLTLAVNVSPTLFKSDLFVATLVAILKETKLSPERLELEITETVLIDDFKKTVKTLKTLRDLGVQIALDDFGVKYSSLNYLRQLPLTKLKIDRSFVSEISNNHANPIIDAIIKLGHDLKLTVLAEGIETSAQINYLLQRGCHLLQGHYYSAPLSALDFVNFMNRLPQLTDHKI